MEIVKSIAKRLGKVLLIIMIVLLVVLGGLSVYHRIHLAGSRALLEEKGYYTPVSAGDHSLNLVSYGGAEDKHRIIALGGNGWAFPLELRELADGLLEEGAVYYLARAGYDGSDDVKDDLTAEFVVEDYRRALQNAGIEAPYILMPHSYAGVLASYWVSKYPEEIEGMIVLDGIVPQPFTDAQLQEAKEQTTGMSTIRGVMNLGIGDLALHTFFPADPDYSEDEQKISDAMTLLTLSSRAFVSDLECTITNTNDTWEMLEPNDVPKLYISAENGYQSVEALEEADVLSDYRINQLTEGFEGSEEERRAKAYALEFEEMETYRKEKIQPYAEKLGNCRIVNLPGDHFIHLDKPQECAELILNFVDGLD